MQIAEGLLKACFDSGLITLKVAEENPKKLRVDRVLGSAEDP